MASNRKKRHNSDNITIKDFTGLYCSSNEEENKPVERKEMFRQLSEGSLEALKQEIYWLCEKLRRLDSFNLSNTTQYKEIKQKLDKLNIKYIEAQKFLDNFLEECSKVHYIKLK